MVSCSHCSTPNTLDSAFCKRCGTALPEAELQVEKEKIDALVAEGNVSFNDAKTSEAMAIAETALASNPSSTSALALKALCHERRGELGPALECADRIVELNPDSELDKIRRNQLRTKLATTVQLAAVPPDRRTALVGAVAAMVLVGCLGFVWAKQVNRVDRPSSTGQVARNDPTPKETEGSISPGSQLVGSNQTNQGNNPVNTNPNPGNASVTPNSDSNTAKGSVGDDSGIGPGEFPVVPPVRGPINVATDPSKKSLEPVIPKPDRSTSQTGDGGDPPPPVLEDGNAKKDDPGQIQINLAGNGVAPTKVSGGVDVSNTKGASALAQSGMERFQLGQYASAASSFTQALSAGGDRMVLNQDLGACYDRLGKKSDAIDAYNRSIEACQNALKNGIGNKSSIQTRLDLCRQALKVLQGN